MKKIAQHTVTTALALIVMLLWAHVPLAFAGIGCGGSGEDCCTSEPACDPNLVCDGSTCVSCGEGNEPCCTSGPQCEPSFVCDGSNCVACGGENEPCCESLMCAPGLICQSTGGEVPVGDSLEGRGGGAGGSPSDTCVHCGDPNEPCCDAMNCNGESVICILGTCSPCGGSFEPCCDIDGCETGTVCEPCDLNGEILDGQGGGALGNPCIADQVGGMGSGGAPVDGICLPCGGADQPCCDPFTCDPGQVCVGITETLDQGSAAAGGFLNGTCVPCGGDNERCCEGGQCDAGDICDGSTCVPCGAENEPCCDSLTCDPGLNCEIPSCDEAEHGNLDASGGAAALGPEICVNCGDPNEPCCNGTDCNAGAVCLQGICESCGGDFEPCCDSDICDTGFICEPLCPNETVDGQGGGAAGTPCPAEQLSGLPLEQVCRPCGGAEEPCCEEMSCDEGFVCRMIYGETAGEGGGAEGFLNGSCFPCGALGEPCCEESMCDGDNLLCDAEFCEACGEIGEQCCAENTCPNSGGICQDGVCSQVPAPVAGASGIVVLLLILTGIGAYRLRRA